MSPHVVYGSAGLASIIFISLGAIAHDVNLFLFHTKPTQFLLVFSFTVLHSLRQTYFYHTLFIFITDPISLICIFIYLQHNCTVT